MRGAKASGERRFGRARAFLSAARALFLVPLWLVSPRTRKRGYEQAFFARITKGVGLIVSQHGNSSHQPATLFVMNHISWADIPVMLSILDADYVAKADILRWPVVGRLAERFDPIFVARGHRLGSQAQVDAIRTRLRSGRSVILCPEGTTSDGASILPFRTSLFAAADAADVIQPLIVNYLKPDGSALDRHRQREVAWIDDDELLSGVARFAKAKTVARVEFLPAVTAGGDRKTLAENVRALMLAAYAAAPKRPE